MIRPTRLALAWIAVLLIGIGESRGATLNPDAFFRIRDLDSNGTPDFVATSSVRVSSIPSIAAHSDFDQAFMEFALAAQQLVQTAVLTVNGSTQDQTSLGFTFNVFTYSTGTGANDIARWDEGSLVTSKSGSGTSFSLSIDVTTAFNAALISGDPYLGIRFDDVTNVQPLVYNPSVFLDGIALTTTQVPEPSSLILAAFGLIGLAAWGWRRNR